MVGTIRSRVSFFMKRFRNLGLIEYKDRIRVHKSLLNVILHDQIGERNAKVPSLGVATALGISEAAYQLQWVCPMAPNPISTSASSGLIETASRTKE